MADNSDKTDATYTRRKILKILGLVGIVGMLLMAGTALGAISLSASVDDNTIGETTEMTLDITAGTNEGGSSLNGIQFGSENADEFDFSNVGVEDVSTLVITNTTEGTTTNITDDLNSVSSSNSGQDVTVDLGGSYQIQEGEIVQITFGDVQNPDSTGTYGVDATLNPQTDTTPGVTTIEITSPTFNIEGGVTDGENVSLENVNIDVTQDGSTVNNTTTNADGSYNLTVPTSGTYNVTYDKTGYNVVETQVNLTQENDSIVENVTLYEYATLNGTLEDDAGDPVENETMELVNSNDTVVSSDTTDADGNYSLTGIPDGEYTLTSTYEDFDNKTVTVDNGDVQTSGSGAGLPVPSANQFIIILVILVVGWLVFRE